MKKILKYIWLQFKAAKTRIRKKLFGERWIETVPAIKAPGGLYGGRRITHTALYTDGNAGDVLLPRALRDLLECSEGPVQWQGMHVHKPVSEDMLELINHSDGLVIGGGGLFLKDTNPNRLSGWQWSCSVETLKRIDVPIILFAVGYNRFRGQDEFEPVFTEHLKLLAEKALFIGLRNHGSMEALKRYLPESLHAKLVFQPCMTTLCKKLYPDLVNENKNLTGTGPIALNCAFDRIENRLGPAYEQILRELAVAMRTLSLQHPIAYFAHDTRDERMLPYLDEVGVPYELVRLHDVHPREIIKAYSRASLVLGMRGHAQMIPFGCGTPILSLISHDKMRWFLNDLNHPEWGIEMQSADFQNELPAKASLLLNSQDSIGAEIERIQEQWFQLSQQNVSSFTAALERH